MNFIKIGFLGVIFSCGLSACGENNFSSSENYSAADKESMRNIAANVEKIAEDLVVINPKHDKQYYIDRQSEVIEKCINSDDLFSCYKSELDVMQHE